MNIQQDKLDNSTQNTPYHYTDPTGMKFRSASQITNEALKKRREDKSKKS